MAQGLPPRPPNCQTSKEVRSGISHAYSGAFNSRGLEKVWHGPYGHMFHDLAFPYDGHLHSQYPLWIPSLVATELRLRQKFRDNEMSYDSDGEENDEMTTR